MGEAYEHKKENRKSNADRSVDNNTICSRLRITEAGRRHPHIPLLCKNNERQETVV